MLGPPACPIADLNVTSSDCAAWSDDLAARTFAVTQAPVTIRVITPRASAIRRPTRSDGAWRFGAPRARGGAVATRTRTPPPIRADALQQRTDRRHPCRPPPRLPHGTVMRTAPARPPATGGASSASGNGRRPARTSWMTSWSRCLITSRTRAARSSRSAPPRCSRARRRGSRPGPAGTAAGRLDQPESTCRTRRPMQPERERIRRRTHRHEEQDVRGDSMKL